MVVYFVDQWRVNKGDEFILVEKEDLCFLWSPQQNLGEKIENLAR